MVDLSPFLGGSGGGKGWTIATLLIFGIIVSLFLTTIAGYLGYGLSAVLNMSNTMAEVFSTAFNETNPQTITLQAGNYTAVIPHQRNPVLDTMQSAIIPLLQAFLTLLSNPLYLGMVLAVTLIIIGLEIEGKNI